MDVFIFKSKNMVRFSHSGYVLTYKQMANKMYTRFIWTDFLKLEIRQIV